MTTITDFIWQATCTFGYGSRQGKLWIQHVLGPGIWAILQANGGIETYFEDKRINAWVREEWDFDSCPAAKSQVEELKRCRLNFKQNQRFLGLVSGTKNHG